ncbi:DNA-directed RNA polymerase subunit omega [Helicovermis profundi]|uniref:DNA-directed RNA polymerase subunit omega n=1 Tax=Helicovermis profundi TaxID=3065157 RepID=A0AAU9E4E9_9FIRM|nr:DNA-directed RNA polymerase subunit omega [Clostridia bacterium S502]
MLKPPVNKMIEIAGSRYALVIAVSKRARQLIEGDEALIETNSIKPVTIAINEIEQDKVECINPVE